MARTKEFRPEAALDAAMQLFWRKGYEATSMRDLLDGMGIGRGSFYDTFGDKHALFLAALDRFEEVRTAWVDEALEGSGLDGIEEVFRRTVEGLVGFRAEEGMPAGEHRGRARPARSRRWRPGSRATSAAPRRRSRAPSSARREAGEIPATADPKVLARFLVSNLHGLRVLARAGSDRETLEDAVSVALGSPALRPVTFAVSALAAAPDGSGGG